MRSTNRKRALLVSGSVILLCMTIIVGMTWALFTDTETVSNHLRTGDLDITLVRQSLKKSAIFDVTNGTMTEKTYNTTNDGGYLVLSDPSSNNKNIFKVYPNGQADNSAELIVPGSSYTANMAISNNESDVDFVYWLGIVVKDASGNIIPNTGDVGNLAKAVTVTVTPKNGNPRTVTLKSGFEIGSPESPIGTFLAANGEDQWQEFTVTLTLEGHNDNTDSDNYAGFTYDPKTGTLTSKDNDAMGGNLVFDMIVYAVQTTN